MEVQTHSFCTRDGLALFSQSWLPQEPKAAVILAHGYAEHTGRYQNLTGVLAAHGYAVHAFDQRGHGRSQGTRANVGVFREYVDDLARFIDHVRERYPLAPRYLFGHSLGGIVGLVLLLEHPEKLSGAIISAPYVRNAVKVSPLLERGAQFLSRLAPELPVQRLEAEALSRDAAVVAAYKDDPLVYHGKVKARLGAELLRAGPYVLERAASITLPLLLLHGTDDRLADVSGTQELFTRVASADKTLKLYAGAYHEVCNDLGKEQVHQDVLAWLAARAV